MAARVRLRRATLADKREYLASVKASHALHHLWVSAASTPKQFRGFIERMSRPENCALLVCERESNRIVGAINITNIVLGVFRSGYLGFYAFAGFERRGLMHEGLRAAVRYAFDKLKLHRLEANIQPGNAASIALVKSCGFSKEGYSPRYLKIAGRWRDHERWAIRAS